MFWTIASIFFWSITSNCLTCSKVTDDAEVLTLLFALPCSPSSKRMTTSLFWNIAFPIHGEVRQEPLTLLFDFFLFAPYALLFALLDKDFITLTIFSRQFIDSRPNNVAGINITRIRQVHYGSRWSRLDRFLNNQDLSSPSELPKYVGAQSEPTYDCARTRGARRSVMQPSYVERSDRSKGAVRPFLGTGQTGRQWESATTDERSPGRDPVRASARRIVLRSTCHLECLQTSRRRKKNSRWRLEELGLGKDKK